MQLATRLAGPHDAEDLVQATYVRALEHGEGVRKRGSWLRQVLVNERRMDLRAGYRRHARHIAATNSAVTDTGADDVQLDDVVHCLEVARIVSTLVDELDDDVQLVVRQRYFDGDTAAEIARQHAIPAGTVRWRLKTGLDRLRDQLDARYGGKRALWAGGFVPTLWDGAASDGVPAATANAAAKGMHTMTIKILAAAALVAVTAGGIATAQHLSSDAPSEASPTVVPSNVVAASPPTVAAAASAPPTELAASDAPVQTADSDRDVLRSSWQRRVADIKAAHAHDTPHAVVWNSADDSHGEPCPDGECGGCQGVECIGALAPQVFEMVKECEGLVDDTTGTMAMTAKVVGAPDVGTVVASVDLDRDDGNAPELTECLTEAMYTLDLGPAEESFEQDVTVMLGGAFEAAADVKLDGLNLEHLDEQTRERVRQALRGEASDDPDAGVRVMHFATATDAPPPS